MNSTTQRRTLYAAAAGWIAVGLAAVVWSFGGLPRPDPTAGSRTPDRDPAQAERTTGRPTQPGGEINFALPLQQTLYDPPSSPPPPKRETKPVAATKPTPPRVPRLDWTLLGTLIDSQRRVAILSDTSGKTDIRGVGEQLELTPPGVLVRAVDSDSVTLEHRGSRSTIRLNQDFPSGAAGGGNSRGGRRRNR